MNMSLFWLIALILFGVLEAVTVGLTSIWFAVGALAALVACAADAPMLVQVVVFLGVSFLTLLLVRPMAQKYVNDRHVATNADRVIGREAVVIQKIDNLEPAVRRSRSSPWGSGSGSSASRESRSTLRQHPARSSRLKSKGGSSMHPFAALGTFLVPVVLIVLVILILAANIKVVQQSKAYVVERLGAFHSVWGVGIHFKLPFLEKVAKVVSLKEQVVDFAPQPVITKDNVTMQIDTVIYFQITDPKLYTYGVEHPMSAIENLTATTLRNIIGELELDQTLTSRDIINSKMRALLDEATDPWGIKVGRVELKNIIPPREIQDAMEKQMKAERERRESILQAEGQKQSQILVAEGEKQSLILRAEAAKEAAIKKAEGEAEAIRKVQEATAEAIKLLNEANASDAVVKLKALEAFQAAADGKATKIIIPSEIQGLAGLCASAKALLEPDGRPTDTKK